MTEADNWRMSHLMNKPRMGCLSNLRDWTCNLMVRNRWPARIVLLVSGIGSWNLRVIGSLNLVLNMLTRLGMMFLVDCRTVEPMWV